MAVVRVPDLRQQVYEGLRDAIRRGDYPPETRFMEQSVARDFGVSRTPAREALARLAQNGLIVQDGRKFRFPNYTAKEIDQVFEVRRRLEPFAARLAVTHATATQIKALCSFIEGELDSHSRDESYVAANQRIRDKLFALCGNPFLESAIHLHEDYIHFVRMRTLTIPAVRAVSVEGMRNLTRALQERDAQGAEEAMNFLLTEAQSSIRRTADADESDEVAIHPRVARRRPAANARAR